MEPPQQKMTADELFEITEQDPYWAAKLDEQVIITTQWENKPHAKIKVVSKHLIFAGVAENKDCADFSNGNLEELSGTFLGSVFIRDSPLTVIKDFRILSPTTSLQDFENMGLVEYIQTTQQRNKYSAGILVVSDCPNLQTIEAIVQKSITIYDCPELKTVKVNNRQVCEKYSIEVQRCMKLTQITGELHGQAHIDQTGLISTKGIEVLSIGTSNIAASFFNNPNLKDGSGTYKGAVIHHKSGFEILDGLVTSPNGGHSTLMEKDTVIRECPNLHTIRNCKAFKIHIEKNPNLHLIETSECAAGWIVDNPSLSGICDSMAKVMNDAQRKTVKDNLDAANKLRSGNDNNLTI